MSWQDSCTIDCSVLWFALDLNFSETFTERLSQFQSLWQTKKKKRWARSESMSPTAELVKQIAQLHFAIELLPTRTSENSVMQSVTALFPLSS